MGIVLIIYIFKYIIDVSYDSRLGVDNGNDNGLHSD